MSTSDHHSDRVVEPSTKSVLNTPILADSGADGGDVLAFNITNARMGVRGLAAMRSVLTDRDWAILHSLEQLHFLTTRQVERLHYPPGMFTTLSAARSSRRDLGGLHRRQLIRHLERRIGGLRAGSASFVWTLDEVGARLLDHSTRRRAQEPSRLHLDHVLAVSELVVRLHEHARPKTIELLEIQTEPGCWRTVPAAHGGRLTLKPDLRLTLGVDEAELHWFVEIDRGSEHRPVLTRKCTAYLLAWRSGREQRERGVFPRVVWVAPDAARVAVIRSVVSKLAGAPAGMFVTVTEAEALPFLVGEEVQA